VKKFRFSLEGLRTAKTVRKKQRQSELADRQRTLVAEQQTLRSLGAKRGESEAGLSRKQMDVFAPGEALLAIRYLERISGLIKNQQGRVEGLVEQVDLCRAGLAEAAKEQKVVDRLREKQQWEFLKTVQRKEQNDLDEVGQQRTTKVS
jgi:flagellar export protein FliJ